MMYNFGASSSYWLNSDHPNKVPIGWNVIWRNSFPLVLSSRCLDWTGWYFFLFCLCHCYFGCDYFLLLSCMAALHRLIVAPHTCWFLSPFPLLAACTTAFSSFHTGWLWLLLFALSFVLSSWPMLLQPHSTIVVLFFFLLLAQFFWFPIQVHCCPSPCLQFVQLFFFLKPGCFSCHLCPLADQCLHGSTSWLLIHFPAVLPLAWLLFC